MLAVLLVNLMILNYLLMKKKPALILICESWCNSNINNAFLSIDNYYLEPNLRYDRCDTQFGIGGGLLVYVRNGLHVLPIDNKYDFNQYCKFKISTSNSFVNIVLVYRPPNCSRENSEKLIKLIENATANTMIIKDA